MAERCRVVLVDGTAVSVRGPAAMSPSDVEAFSQVVRAAKQHVADNPPPVSKRVKNLADRIERGDILTISRPGLKAAVREELRRRHPEPIDSPWHPLRPDCVPEPHSHLGPDPWRSDAEDHLASAIGLPSRPDDSTIGAS